MLAGVTVKLAPVILPGCNVYVEAPPGVMTELFPEQTLLLLTELIVMVGVGFTLMVTVKLLDAVLIQPPELVPLIVYTVVLIGFTVKVVPVLLPGCNV